MTALVIEGVSTQDLDEMDEATCCADSNPAVAITTHEGCPTPSFYCSKHVAAVYREQARFPDADVRHKCGARFPLGQVIVRLI